MRDVRLVVTHRARNFPVESWRVDSRVEGNANACSQTRIARTRPRETYVGGQVATCLAGRLAGSSDSGEPDDCKVK